MNKPMAALAVILLSGGAVLGFSGAALAEDVTPIDTPVIVLDDIPTDEPITVPLDAPVVTEESVVVDTVPAYNLLAWHVPGGPDSIWEPDQTLITNLVEESADLNALDNYDFVGALGLACETSAYIQIDLELNDATTDALVAGGVLYNPNEPTEHHAYGAVDGNPWKYITVTAPDCAPEECTVTGAGYTEDDDIAPVDTMTGKSFVATGAKPVSGYRIPVTGNLQGVSTINFTTEQVTGYGIFFRFVVDLTGDGLGGYNSLSLYGTNSITQDSVATDGSKAIFVGKTVAEIAAEYPHNKITSIGWQTGSNWPAGDGATLVSYDGCGFATFVPTVELPLVLASTGANTWISIVAILISVVAIILGMLSMIIDRRNKKLAGK